MFPPRRWRPSRPVQAAAVAALLAAATAGYGWWVAHGPSRPAEQADVVVVHAGGEPWRSARGIDLMEAGVAPTLVVFLGSHVRGPARALCGRTEPYEVLCPDDLDPVTTRGEARSLGRLAAARGWRSAVVVTSDYHLRRAAYLDRRCAGLSVTGAAADRQTTRRWYHLGREMVAVPRSAALGC